MSPLVPRVRGDIPEWWLPGGALFLARLSDALARFGLFFATARLLSPPEFSAYALLTAALAIGQWLLSLGAPRVALYFHVRGERGALYAWLYLLAAAATVLVLAVLAGVSPARALLFAGVPVHLVALGLAPLPFLLLVESFGATLVAAGRARAYGATLWVRNLGMAVVLGSSLAAADRLSWVLAGRFAVSAAVAVVTIALARGRPAWSGLRSLAPAAIAYGGPTALSDGAVALHRRADVLLLSALGHAGQIGAYSLSYAIAETFWLVTDSLENAFFVDVTRGLRARVRGETRRALRLYAALGVAGAAGSVLLGELLIRLFFSRYREASRLLPWLVVAAVAWGVARPLYSSLSSQARVRTVLLCHLAGLAVNLTLCSLWIPPRGALGAAQACLASYAAQSAAFWVAFSRVIASEAKQSTPSHLSPG